MSGDAAAEEALEAQFKGLSKHFNAVTTRGRANVAKATLATLALIATYVSLKPKSKK